MGGGTLSPQLRDLLIKILHELGRPVSTEELVRLLRDRAAHLS